jgi:hypothetical protein
MMTVNPILLTIWAALAVCFIGLLMYRGQLTRYEDDQLFLNDDANSSEKELQTKIVQRVNRIEPVYDAWRRIQ